MGTYTADGPVTPTWSVEGDDMDAFTIGGSSGVLMFASPPDFEARADMGMDNMYQVTVKAEAGGEMAMMDVTVTVINEDELGMLAGQDSVEYMENGTVAVGTYTADGPVTPTWSVEGDDMDAFTIGGSSGVLMFASPPDFEARADMGMDNMYQVTVKAEAGGEMAMMDVTVTVTNEDEAPLITGDAAPNYAENGTGPVATYSATDPESATITPSLEGDDAANFEISAGGVLTFRTTPDYESPADADGDNTYMVTVKANDGTYMDTHGVTVMVTNVDEAGTVSLSSRQPVVGTAADRQRGRPRRHGNRAKPGSGPAPTPREAPIPTSAGPRRQATPRRQLTRTSNSGRQRATPTPRAPASQPRA